MPVRLGASPAAAPALPIPPLLLFGPGIKIGSCLLFAFSPNKVERGPIAAQRLQLFYHRLQCEGSIPAPLLAAPRLGSLI